MEFLKKVESKGPLSCDTVLKIFYQTCRAVQHMHKQKPPIIHRDLKVPPQLMPGPAPPTCPLGWQPDESPLGRAAPPAQAGPSPRSLRGVLACGRGALRWEEGLLPRAASRRPVRGPSLGRSPAWPALLPGAS